MVQARRGRVEAAVERDRARGEGLAQRASVGALRDRPRQCRSSRMSVRSRGVVLRRRSGGQPARHATASAGRRRGTAGRYADTRRLAVEPEPPRRRRAVARDPDPRPARGPRASAPAGAPAARRSADRGSVSVGAVVPPSTPSADVSRAGPRARSRGDARRRTPCAARASTPSTTSPARSSTAEASPVGPADEVHAPVHAVGEVDVDVAGRPEHHRVARRPAAVGVRAGVAPRRRRPRPRSAGPRPVRRAQSCTTTRRAGRAPPRAPGGRRTRGRQGGQPSPVAQAACACAASASVGQLLGDPGRRGAAVASSAASERAAHREHRRGRRASAAGRPTARSSSATSHSSQAVLVAEPHQRAGDLVRVAERHAAADQPLGDVGGQRVPGGGGRGQPLVVGPAAWRPCRRARAARAAAARPSRRPAPCPPAGRGRRPAAGP